MVSVIYLSNLPLLNFANTLQNMAGSHEPKHSEYIWFCNSRGEQHLMLPLNLVGSYSTFSPLPARQCHTGCYFLLRVHAFTNISHFGSRMPCVARTFLYTNGAATERPALMQKYLFSAKYHHGSSISVFFKRCILVIVACIF